MKQTRVSISLLMACAISSQIAFSGDLVVAPGATRIILATEQNMILKNLVLGNGSKIGFAPDVDHWEVWAESATFGENALIDARGATGANGTNGKKGRSTNTPGKYGEAGGPGIAGERGRPGVDLFFRVKVAQFGGVLIDSTGGIGGVGGNGGNGGKSGDARCPDRKKARNGERGGNAGAGGDGGGGGTIDFRYTSAENFTDEHTDEVRELTLPGINLVSDGGSGSAPGVAGKGGAGGHGNSACIPKLGGGKRGSRGHKAEAGQMGAPGTVSIIKDDFGPAAFPDPNKDTPGKPEDPKYYDDPRYP